MRRRWIAAGITVCMAMTALAGCGSKPAASAEATTAASEAATAATTAADTAASSEAATTAAGAKGEAASATAASGDGAALAGKAPSDYGPSVKAIVDKGVLTMATGTYVPFEYRDDSNKIVGFDVDLARYIADKMGVKLEVMDMPFQSIVPSIQNGEYDIAIAAMYDTPERREVVLMSDSYCDTGMIMAVKQGSSLADTVKSLADCGGMKVAVKAGATSEKVARDFMAENPDVKYEVVGYEDTVGCVSDLLAGRVDVVVNDLLNMKELAKTYPGTKIVTQPFTQAANAAAVQKGKDDLMQFVNDCIAGYKEDGTFDELWAKWIE